MFLSVGFSLELNNQTNSSNLIIKFDKNYAPLLGSQNSLSIEDLKQWAIDINFDDLKDLKPLFNNIDIFTELHYQHELHQYYKLTLNTSNTSPTQIALDLKI